MFGHILANLEKTGFPAMKSPGIDVQPGLEGPVKFCTFVEFILSIIYSTGGESFCRRAVARFRSADGALKGKKKSWKFGKDFSPPPYFFSNAKKIDDRELKGKKSFLDGPTDQKEVSNHDRFHRRSKKIILKNK